MKNYVEAQATLNALLAKLETGDCPYCFGDSVCAVHTIAEEIRKARNLLATAFDPDERTKGIPEKVQKDIVQNELGDHVYWPMGQGFLEAWHLRQIADECDRRNGGSHLGATMALIDRLRAVAKAHGWAIGVHGSLVRDIDLIAVPWAETACDWYDLYVALCFKGALWGTLPEQKPTRGNMANKPHGRLAVIIIQPGAESIQTDAPGQYNPPAIDLSFVDPRSPAEGA